MNNKIAEAVSLITAAMKEDPDYRYSWQANIAVQMQDEWQRSSEKGGLPCTREHIHEISNTAAKNFLDLLCREPIMTALKCGDRKFEVGEPVELFMKGGSMIVDSEFLPILKLFSWNIYASRSGDFKRLYARTSLPSSLGGGGILLHTFIMYVILKKDRGPKMIVDHKDGNSLNNCSSNLRLVSFSQNNMNRRCTRGASSFKGIMKTRCKRKWIAVIGIGKKKIYLGTFSSEIDAAKAYDKKAIELFGEYARPNFPLNLPSPEGKGGE